MKKEISVVQNDFKGVDFQNTSYEEMQKIYEPSPKKVKRFDLQLFAIFFGVASLLTIAMQSKEPATFNQKNQVVSTQEAGDKTSKVAVDNETIQAIDLLDANSAYKLTLAQNYKLIENIKKFVETDKNALNKEQMSKAINYLFSFQENVLNNVYKKELAFSPEAEKIAFYDSTVAKSILETALNK